MLRVSRYWGAPRRSLISSSSSILLRRLPVTTTTTTTVNNHNNNINNNNNKSMDTASTSSSPFIISQRFYCSCTPLRRLQYEQTSETMKGLNESKQTHSFFSRRRRAAGKEGDGGSATKRMSSKEATARKKASKWISKSTKDYMSEAENRNLALGRTPTRHSGTADTSISVNASVKEDNDVDNRTSLIFQSKRETLADKQLDRKEQKQQLTEAADAFIEKELDRMRDDNSSRIRKMINFFKRQGKAFTVFYLVVYFSGLALLYFLFSMNYLRKDEVFEFMLTYLSVYIDKDKFLERLEAWDTYIDFAFAFLINDILEFIRLPSVLFICFALGPLFNGARRNVRPSIFRRLASES